MRVLIVEDDRKMAAVLAQGFEEAEFEVELRHDGRSGLQAAESVKPDFIVLDVMLPELDGMQVLSSIRESSATPVLMLTARDTVDDRIRGLQAGADDYVGKPFVFPELMARVHCILRRGRTHSPLVLRVADLELDTLKRCATRGGRRIDLTSKEFALLSFFMRHVGEPLSRTMIASKVWGIDFDTETNVVEVSVRRLRAKMDDPFDTKLIKTERGVGYVLEPHAS